MKRDFKVCAHCREKLALEALRCTHCRKLCEDTGTRVFPTPEENKLWGQKGKRKYHSHGGVRFANQISTEEKGGGLVVEFFKVLTFQRDWRALTWGLVAFGVYLFLANSDPFVTVAMKLNISLIFILPGLLYSIPSESYGSMNKGVVILSSAFALFAVFSFFVHDEVTGKDRAREYTKRGEQLVQEGSYLEALEKFEKALKIKEKGPHQKRAQKGAITCKIMTNSLTREHYWGILSSMTGRQLAQLKYQKKLPRHLKLSHNEAYRKLFKALDKVLGQVEKDFHLSIDKKGSLKRSGKRKPLSIRYEHHESCRLCEKIKKMILSLSFDNPELLSVQLTTLPVREKGKRPIALVIYRGGKIFFQSSRHGDEIFVKILEKVREYAGKIKEYRSELSLRQKKKIIPSFRNRLSNLNFEKAQVEAEIKELVRKTEVKVEQLKKLGEAIRVSGIGKVEFQGDSYTKKEARRLAKNLKEEIGEEKKRRERLEELSKRYDQGLSRLKKVLTKLEKVSARKSLVGNRGGRAVKSKEGRRPLFHFLTSELLGKAEREVLKIRIEATFADQFPLSKNPSPVEDIISEIKKKEKEKKEKTIEEILSEIQSGEKEEKKSKQDR